MEDKMLLVKKYGLKHEDNAWYSEKENSHKHLIFKDTFFEKTDIIGLLFRINKLCMAKVKYFRKNNIYLSLIPFHLYGRLKMLVHTGHNGLFYRV